ncbi:MAG: YiiD C-terminal domain-containing protein [Thermodesulfobacteriota bacterium]|nr:YiiD C-terminal domain-containing protein [Thermodesulfobacteriota bacterium]
MAISDKNRELVTSLEKIIRIVDKMEMRIEKFEKGSIEVRLPKEPNINHIGTIYAGSLFSLADFTGGILFSTCFNMEKYYTILKEMTITFKRPATTDITIAASLTSDEIETIRKMTDDVGKADRLMEFELKDEKGNVCCTVCGDFQLRKA